jgi:hypothetical protein
MDISFFLSAVDPAAAGPKEGKKTPREGFLTYPRFRSLCRQKGEKMSPACQYKNAPESQIQVPKAPSTFHLRAQ